MNDMTEEFKKACMAYAFLRNVIKGAQKTIIESLFVEIRRLEKELEIAQGLEGKVGPRGHPGQAQGKLLCKEIGVPPEHCVCQGKGEVPCEARYP